MRIITKKQFDQVIYSTWSEIWYTCRKGQIHYGKHIEKTRPTWLTYRISPLTIEGTLQITDALYAQNATLTTKYNVNNVYKVRINL